MWNIRGSGLVGGIARQESIKQAGQGSGTVEVRCETRSKSGGNGTARRDAVSASRHRLRKWPRESRERRPERFVAGWQAGSVGRSVGWLAGLNRSIVVQVFGAPCARLSGCSFGVARSIHAHQTISQTNMRCENGASPRKLEKTLENGSNLDGGEEWRLVGMVPCSSPVHEKRMAGDDGTTTNNEILGAEGGEEEQGTSARGELHSRVGGILECDPPGNRNSSNERPAATAAANNEDGVCRYAVGAANRAMSFFEMCQVS